MTSGENIFLRFVRIVKTLYRSGLWNSAVCYATPSDDFD